MLDPRLPLVKSDSEVSSNELLHYFRQGIRAINYQAQNDTNLKDFNLQPAKDTGLSAGVWGVSYHRDNFFRDGKALALQAKKLGAQHVTMDIEMALKNTRPGGAKAVIDGVRAGDWTGPVHLNTLGGPINPRTGANPSGNDYGFDYQSFTDTGGGVFLQCYFNMADEYRPEPSIEHAKACGVPEEKLNCTVSLAYSEPYAPKPGIRLSGEQWIPLLREAGVTKNYSVFLAKSIQPGDLEALATVAVPVPPVPEPKPLTAAQTRAEIVKLVQTWESNQTKPIVPASRLPLIRRIAWSTDPQWDDIRNQIEELIEGAGIEF